MNEANTIEDIIGLSSNTVSGAVMVNSPQPFPRDPLCPPRIEPPMSTAFELLKSAIQSDPAYAWAWHCNIAMPILDSTAGVTREGANEAAATVMQHLFGVDMRSSQEWLTMFNTAQHGSG